MKVLVAKKNILISLCPCVRGGEGELNELHEKKKMQTLAVAIDLLPQCDQ